jgi:hypothetical protein
MVVLLVKVMMLIRCSMKNLVLLDDVVAVQAIFTNND